MFCAISVCSHNVRLHLVFSLKSNSASVVVPFFIPPEFFIPFNFVSVRWPYFHHLYIVVFYSMAIGLNYVFSPIFFSPNGFVARFSSLSCSSLSPSAVLLLNRTWNRHTHSPTLTHTHTIIRTITAYWKSAMHYFGDGIFENDRRHNSMNILCECKTLPGPHLVCIKLSNSGTLGIFVWVCEHFWSLNGLGVFQRKIEKC